VTDAERQVAGKTYRSYTGELRTFDSAGKNIDGPCSADDMLWYLAEGKAVEVTAEPEVKVGDRFEWTNLGTWGEDRARVVTEIRDGRVYGNRISNGERLCLGSLEGVHRKLNDGSLRRLPPEPKPNNSAPKPARVWDIGSRVKAKPGYTGVIAELEDGMLYAAWDDGVRSCPVTAASVDEKFSDGWWTLLPKEESMSDRALEMPKRAKASRQPAPCLCGDSDVCICGHSTDVWLLSKMRKPACVCLQRTCVECGEKLRSDRSAMLGTMDREAARAATDRRSGLPAALQYSPAAMMGGFWGTRGRK